MAKQIPVYLFTGFLESGKTKFIQETLEDKRFGKGERTLLLVCEEGEEEYAPDQFAGKDTFIRVLESENELTRENLSRFIAETKAVRVLVEYNGMWMLDRLYNEMPEGWVVYQEFFFADAGTFLSYNANMRQLVYDKLKSCELAVFNRFNGTMDKMDFHKIVRGASRRADIAYEYVGGKVEYDDIEDPLPFDKDADVIEIEDRDYALFYRDLSEDMASYDGKTVRFKAVVARDKAMGTGTMFVGRHIMVCCQDDIQYSPLVCKWGKSDEYQNYDWVMVEAKIKITNHKLYQAPGPVLNATSITRAYQPTDPVATFY